MLTNSNISHVMNNITASFNYTYEIKETKINDKQTIDAIKRVYGLINVKIDKLISFKDVPIHSVACTEIASTDKIWLLAELDGAYLCISSELYGLILNKNTLKTHSLFKDKQIPLFRIYTKVIDKNLLHIKKSDIKHYIIYYKSMDKLHNENGPAHSHYIGRRLSEELYYLHGNYYTKLQWLKVKNAPKEEIVQEFKSNKYSLRVPNNTLNVIDSDLDLDGIIIQMDDERKLVFEIEQNSYELHSLSNCGTKFMLKKVIKEETRKHLEII